MDSALEHSAEVRLWQVDFLLAWWNARNEHVFYRLG